MFTQQTSCRTGFCMQVSLVFVYSSGISSCGWEVVRGARGELGMVLGWYGCAVVSHAVWHQPGSLGSSVIFSCSVGEKLTQLASLITTTAANWGKQERSGTSASHHSRGGTNWDCCSFSWTNSWVKKTIRAFKTKTNSGTRRSWAENFWRLGECGREVFMCGPHFYVLRGAFSAGH